MNTYVATVSSHIASGAASDARIFSLMFEGAKIWVKRGEKDCSTNLQRFVYRLSKRLARRMPPARRALYIEVTTLRALRRDGLCVPQVLGIHEGFIVLSDTGMNVAQLMRSTSDADMRKKLVSDTAFLLAQIHKATHWHGNAKLRNFTYNGEAMSAIDFENSYSLWPLGYRRVKDIFMLCGSTTAFDKSGALIHTALGAYKSHLSVCGLYAFALMLSPLYLLLYPLAPHLGRDIREAWLTLGAIYRSILK